MQTFDRVETNQGGTLDMENQIIGIVSGGSSGMGAAVAQRMASRGAIVFALSRRGGSDEHVGEGRVIHKRCDISDPAAVKALSAEIPGTTGTQSQVQFLVHAAGAMRLGPIRAMTDEDWQEQIATDLSGAFYLTRLFLEVSAASPTGGRKIIYIAGGAAGNAWPYASAYSAAKTGLLGLTRSLAAELAADGIDVNTVCPSIVDSPMLWAFIREYAPFLGRSEEEVRREYETANMQKRVIPSEEIADVVEFLLGPGSSCITGQAIQASAGLVV